MSNFIKKIASLNQDSILDTILQSKIQDVKRANVTREDEYKRLLILKRASKNLGIENLDNIAELVRCKISNLNDAYYFILKTRFNKIKKIAYPNYAQNYYDEVQFDLNKWMDLTHQIYDAVQSGRMQKEAAIEHFSQTLNLNNEEDIAFKRWFNHYASGEHKKYSNQEDFPMKKEAVYMSDTMNLGPYSHSGGSIYRTKSTEGFNFPGSSLEPSEETLNKSDVKNALKGWKAKLLSRIRGIQKLMVADEYVDPETFDAISRTLHDLAKQVYGVRLETTASDLTSKAANSLVKIGAFSEAKELRKIAQEVAAGTAPEAAAEPTAPAAGTAPATPPAAPGEATEAAEAPKKDEPKDAIPRGDDVEPVAFEDIVPTPGAKPGEYEELAGSISIKNASSKLDEVAGMLADRRIIRLLAEFDIMLDRLGIASMFPELAESQSKLIDAYSYALTRVTKMMGQLANAQAVMNSASSVPGSNFPRAVQPSEETTETQE